MLTFLSRKKLIGWLPDKELGILVVYFPEVHWVVRIHGVGAQALSKRDRAIIKTYIGLDPDEFYSRWCGNPCLEIDVPKIEEHLARLNVPIRRRKNTKRSSDSPKP